MPEIICGRPLAGHLIGYGTGRRWWATRCRASSSNAAGPVGRPESPAASEGEKRATRHHLFTIAVEGDETSSRLVFAESANQAVRLYFAHHRITKSDREILAYYSERTIFILPASQESDLPGVVQWEHERKEVRFFNPRWLEAPADERGESSGT